ncbi:hypothetical protein GOP47_0025089 [Adiantum capillus-veneris]|uniref:very-long-chain 3-oxoacyl-CoA synthase n=1 Tax=Adiantum capillus-veneris TaxID=13818 RepID=A0A9D4Z484_ADICA|nr:hypothetical protein GOP47_0025089 [Adiantum capillus-veneris]
MGSLPQSFFSTIAYWTCAHTHISSFQWLPGITFASSPVFLLSITLTYLLVTLCLSFSLSNRRSPVPLGPFPVIHNLVLFTSSLLMFVGCTMATLSEMGTLPSTTMPSTPPSSSSTSPTPLSWQLVFCFPPGTRASGPVFFWSYVFYLSKFYEFLDTFIMVLKRRPLTFLHVFHHAIVVIMSFFWLQYVQSLQIIALLTNTSVHMLMYSYYLLCSLGIKPFWKKLVTNCQIVQFVFSFMVSFVMLYLHFRGDGCEGISAWTFNAFFNASLLVLFVNFHHKQYRERRMEQQKKSI